MKRAKFKIILEGKVVLACKQWDQVRATKVAPRKHRTIMPLSKSLMKMSNKRVLVRPSPRKRRKRICVHGSLKLKMPAGT